MALSLGDAFLNFTAGAIERNNKIRDENVALALEDFKANKDLYQKIALDRYTRDSNKYDTEIAKMDSLKSVYSFIQDNNLDRNSAASLILSNSMPGFKNLDDKEQKRLIAQTANSFKTKYKTVEGDATPDGVETKQVADGFEIVPEQIKLTTPNMKDYLQDPSFWTNLQNEIKTGTSGPLTEQVLKLLGKEDSSEGAKELLNNLEQKDGTVIKSEGNVPSYTSKNNTLVNFEILEGKYAFGDGLSSEIPTTLTNKYNSYSGTATNDVRKTVIAPMNAMKLEDIDKYFTIKDNGEVTILPGGTSAYTDGRILLNDIVNDLYYNIIYSGGKFAGKEDLFTDGRIVSTYNSEFKERSMKIDINDATGVYIIPTNVLPLGVTFESLGLSKNEVFNYMAKNFPKNKSLSDSKEALNDLVFQYIKANAKQLTNTDSSNANENVDNKGSGTITVTEKIITDIMELNKDKTREEIINELQKDKRYTVPESILSVGNNQSYNNKMKENESKLPFEPNKVFIN